MKILLFIISLIGVILFMPIGLIVSIIKYNPNHFLNLAVSLDQFGNVFMKDIFNWLLISKRSVHKFGNPDETISSVLGKNKRENTLTYTGLLLDSLLNKFEKNHSIKSIEDDE